MVTVSGSLLDGLGDHPVLAADTAPIIYWLEGHPRLADRFAPVFEAAESGDAARIRAAYRLPLRDALQVATSIRAGAAALVTNEAALRRVPGLRVAGPD